MKGYFLGLFSLLLLSSSPAEKVTIFYKGKNVSVTQNIKKELLGLYRGKGKGFLKLEKNGTGMYRYDYRIGSCPNESFPIRWGFIKDENGQPVSFKREYGMSYPILFQSLKGKQFKGCREEVFLDWLLVKKDGIHVSSSDDWKK
ncbi:MAG: hypothetical protein MI784_08385 [Cytophagales bacterium]|nr:hypothetical protein [Cytophagales bacterium]